jgi:adenine-specific DNA-methyltransferase
MIKYLGSKRAFVGAIVDVVRRVGGCTRVLDLFSGTSRVGHALKQAGFQVLCNDHNRYAHTLATCYVQADRERWERPAHQLIEELSRLRGAPGYFTETFCERARYFHPRNGERIDAIREAIACKSLEPELEAVLLVSLMEAADRVDSTTGVQMAYLKNWAPRAHNDLQLRMPALLPRAPHGPGSAHCMDALEAATRFQADVAYLDPPYNQHSYLGNYHIWETLVRWDKPATYGIANKRVDCRSRQSAFNSKRTFRGTFESLIQAVRARHLIVSFSNEGYLAHDELESLLAAQGKLEVHSMDYKRYVGAQIGIYNLKGQKVGKVSHLRNQERLYVVDRG